MKILTFLSFLLLLGGSTLSAQSPASVENLKFRALTDSTTNQYHIQLSFQVPQPKDVSQIQLLITKASTNEQIRQINIPVHRKQGRRNGIGFIRRGNKIWLDLGMRNGYDFKAKVRLVAEDGSLSDVKMKVCQVM